MDEKSESGSSAFHTAEADVIAGRTDLALAPSSDDVSSAILVGAKK